MNVFNDNLKKTIEKIKTIRSFSENHVVKQKSKSQGNLNLKNKTPDRQTRTREMFGTPDCLKTTESKEKGFNIMDKKKLFESPGENLNTSGSSPTVMDKRKIFESPGDNINKDCSPSFQDRIKNFESPIQKQNLNTSSPSVSERRRNYERPNFNSSNKENIGTKTRSLQSVKTIKKIFDGKPVISNKNENEPSSTETLRKGKFANVKKMKKKFEEK